MATSVNATMFWAQLNRKNDLSDKYQVDLGQLSDKAVDALEAQGLTVHDKGDERGSFITCKSNYPIKAQATDGEDVSDFAFGNGTTCVAGLTTYDWKFKGKAGVSANVGKLVIKEFVEYEGAEAMQVNVDEAL